MKERRDKCDIPHLPESREWLTVIANRLHVHMLAADAAEDAFAEQNSKHLQEGSRGLASMLVSLEITSDLYIADRRSTVREPLLPQILLPV